MILQAAIMCLALNGYHEARSEPPEAELAVAMVVLNRAKRNPWAVCNTVFEPYQFSWTILPPAVLDRVAYDRSKLIASEAFATVDFTGGADHYYNPKKVKRPRWIKGMTETGRWGNHIFYRSNKHVAEKSSGG